MKAAVLGVIALGFVAGGCKKKISASKAESIIEDELTKKGVVSAKVSCPEGDRALKKGDVFTCQATADDVEFPVEVTQTDGEGHAQTAYKGVIFPLHLGQWLAQRVHEKFPEATADCGSRTVMSAPKNEHFDCLVQTQQGAYQVTMTITDEYGAYHADLENAKRVATAAKQ